MDCLISFDSIQNMFAHIEMTTKKCKRSISAYTILVQIEFIWNADAACVVVQQHAQYNRCLVLKDTHIRAHSHSYTHHTWGGLYDIFFLLNLLFDEIPALFLLCST